MSADPAVVEGVHEDHPDARVGEPGLGGQLLRADVSQGVPLEQADGDADRGGIDLEGMRGFRGPAKPRAAWPPGSSWWSNFAA
jgi:hypothetical protein